MLSGRSVVWTSRSCGPRVARFLLLSGLLVLACGLWVPATLSTSRDLLILVEEAGATRHDEDVQAA